MEEERHLYPFRICPLQDTYDWGTDTFCIADLGYRDTLVKDGWLGSSTVSELMDLYMDCVVGDNVFEYYGRQFPIQVKHICVKGKMPLRVHPDDETASARYDALGREKMWYVLRAGADASLVLGFNRPLDAGVLMEKVSSDTLDDVLNIVKVKAGDSFHIPPGMVHAACGDVEIIEVSESSPLDFPVWNWGKALAGDEFDTALTLIDALDFINLGKYEPALTEVSNDGGKVVRKLVELKEFTAGKISLTDTLHIYMEKFDSFIVYCCLYGEAAVQVEMEGIGRQNYKVKAGECILVPAEVRDFFLVPLSPSTSLIEAYLSKRDSDVG